MSALSAEGQDLCVILLFMKEKDETALNRALQLVWDYIITSHCRCYHRDCVFVGDQFNLTPRLIRMFCYLI